LLSGEKPKRLSIKCISAISAGNLYMNSVTKGLDLMPTTSGRCDAKPRETCRNVFRCENHRTLANLSHIRTLFSDVERSHGFPERASPEMHGIRPL
jgi:hypothetical protein